MWAAMAARGGWASICARTTGPGVRAASNWPCCSRRRAGRSPPGRCSPPPPPRPCAPGTCPRTRPTRCCPGLADGSRARGGGPRAGHAGRRARPGPDGSSRCRARCGRCWAPATAWPSLVPAATGRRRRPPGACSSSTTTGSGSSPGQPGPHPAGGLLEVDGARVPRRPAAPGRAGRPGRRRGRRPAGRRARRRGPVVPGDGHRVRQGPGAVRPADRPVPGGQAPAGRHGRAGGADGRRWPGTRSLAVDASPGRPPTADGRTTAELAVGRRRGPGPRRLRAAAAKDCLQLLGGIGFTWEHDPHLHLKRALADRQLLGGSATPHRLRLAAAAVGGPDAT